MNNILLIAKAEKFLKEANIAFLGSGKIGRVKNDSVEVIFDRPEILDPTIVIDPPDVRVWVNRKTGLVQLINRM